MDKRIWVEKYLGAYKNLILSHHKNLNKGDYLIDDRTVNGAGEFGGELILFGSEKFKNWKVVTRYLLDKTEKSEKLLQDLLKFDQYNEKLNKKLKSE